MCRLGPGWRTFRHLHLNYLTRSLAMQKVISQKKWAMWHFSEIIMGWKEFVPFLVLVSIAGLIVSYFDSKHSLQPFKTPLPKATYLPIRLPQPTFPPTHPPTSSIKRILYFTPLFKKKDWGFGIGSEPFEQCSNKNCFVTNKGRPEDFDALLFHERNFKQKVCGTFTKITLTFHDSGS